MNIIEKLKKYIKILKGVIFNMDTKDKTTNIPYIMGCLPDPPDSRDHQISSVLKSPIRSGHVDYSNEMSPVKDQKSKGSCVGMAVAAMLEWQQQQEYLREKASGSEYTRNKEHYNLSEQWIYHKAKEIDRFPEDNSGTTIRAAMKVVNKQGVPPEKGWEYSDSSIGEPESWTGLIAHWNKSKRYYRIDTIEEMKKTLNNVGPFVMGVMVFEEMYNTSNGHVSYPSNPNRSYGGHAICLTSYNDSTNEFKFKNSWSTNWGYGGYGWLPYDYVKDFCMSAWVSIDADVKSL